MFWKSRKARRYDFDAPLQFLPVFEAPDFRFAEWRTGEGSFPRRFLTPDALAFIRTLEDHGWIEPFDWQSWQEEAREYIRDHELTACADAATIAKLLTTHVGAERLCEGHLSDMFENGHLLVILRRLRELRDEAGG